MYEEAREIVKEAKAKGLAAVIWSYPRGSGLSKEGETAIDVVTYAAQIAAQLGAHLELAEAKQVYQRYHIPIATLAERVRHVVQSAFDGRRIVIFSGGARAEDEALFAEVRAIHEGGGFGSIVGRNSFQRQRAESLAFLRQVMQLYAGEIQ